MQNVAAVSSEADNRGTRWENWDEQESVRSLSGYENYFSILSRYEMFLLKKNTEIILFLNRTSSSYFLYYSVCMGYYSFLIP